MDVLRMELIGQPVRVSEIDPGLVETEFPLGIAQEPEEVFHRDGPKGPPSIRSGSRSGVGAEVPTVHWATGLQYQLL
jgi:hypothetical protein